MTFNIGHQTGGVINNVHGDQHIAGGSAHFGHRGGRPPSPSPALADHLVLSGRQRGGRGDGRTGCRSLR